MTTQNIVLEHKAMMASYSEMCKLAVNIVFNKEQKDVLT
jgi:hypothetical protein